MSRVPHLPAEDELRELATGHAVGLTGHRLDLLDPVEVGELQPLRLLARRRRVGDVLLEVLQQDPFALLLA